MCVDCVIFGLDVVDGERNNVFVCILWTLSLVFGTKNDREQNGRFFVSNAGVWVIARNDPFFRFWCSAA